MSNKLPSQAAVVVAVILFLAMFPKQAWGENCSQESIELSTQQEVDDFQAFFGGNGGCDTITGWLTVNGANISNINGLINLTKVAGPLRIFGNNILANIDGLTNLASAGGYLFIYDNAILNDLDGLANLTSISGPTINPLIISPKGLYLHGNPALSNINGLTKLREIDGDVIVQKNIVLTNINGLAGLNSVNGSLRVSQNHALTNIDGLQNITSTGNNGEFPSLDISFNPVLPNLNGLAHLTSVGGVLFVGVNNALTNIDGLHMLTSIGTDLLISNNPALTDLDGLANLDSLGGLLYINNNAALTNIDGLTGLTVSERDVIITDNATLTNVDGLSSLTSVGLFMEISGNTNLTNVDGLSSLSGVRFDLMIQTNDLLSQCAGLARLVDQWDDAEPGPGPGVGGFPDIGRSVHLSDNLTGCNSVQEILANVNPSRINAGLNDAWFYEPTSGQGFFITVFPDLGYVSLAWFTYDTELPLPDAVANLGDPGHRWITAIGPIEGNQVTMNIEMTSGGIFDTATLIDRTDPPGSDGTIILTFDSCNSGTVEYDIPSINRQGTVPIQRVAGDNIALCEVLSAD